MTRKVKELSDMEIDEISLVDRPANQYASVLIAKRDDTEEVTVPEIYDENGEAIADFDALEAGQVVYDADNNAYEVEFNEDDEDDEPEGDESEDADEDAEDLVEVGKGVGQMASGFGRGIRGMAGPMGSKGGQAGQTAGAFLNRNKKAIGIGAGAATAGAAGGVMGQKQFGKAESFADEIRESLSKALGDAERDEVISKAMERVETLSKSLEVAEEIAKSERDLRLTREYVEVAKSYNVPVEPTELGPVLMRMAEVLPDEDLAVIHKALSAAGELILDEIGYLGGGDNADVMSQVEGIIDGSIQKNAEGANISKAEAMADFFAQNPAAYDEYLADKRGF